MVNNCLVFIENKTNEPKIIFEIARHIICNYQMSVVFYVDLNEFQILKNRFYLGRYDRISSIEFEQLIREYGIVSIETIE